MRKKKACSPFKKLKFSMSKASFFFKNKQNLFYASLMERAAHIDALHASLDIRAHKIYIVHFTWAYSNNLVH